MTTLDRYRPQRRNANKHSQRGMGQLETSVQADGWIGAITVAADGETFDGSARIELAGAAGFEDAIVVTSDGSRPIVHVRTDIATADDPRAVRLGIAANAIASHNLSWDPVMLAEIGEEIDLSTFWTNDEMAVLMDQDLERGGGDEVPDVEDGPTRTEYGQLWLLGRHRLLVGDSTKAEDVARLMEGASLSLAITDPPYGVNYTDKNRRLNSLDGGSRIETPITNDTGEIADIAEQVWKPAFLSLHSAMSPGAAFYVFAPQGGDQMMMMMMSAVLPVRHELIWLKNNHVLGRADYAYKHEPILYGWKAGAGHFYGGGFQTSVLECDRPQKSDLHPTMKPVELVNRLIENSSKRDDLVGDWFLGSGTTLIACERTGRRCYGIEIEPRYADVCLKRWESETGQVAERTDG